MASSPMFEKLRGQVWGCTHLLLCIFSFKRNFVNPLYTSMPMHLPHEFASRVDGYTLILHIKLQLQICTILNNVCWIQFLPSKNMDIEGKPATLEVVDVYCGCLFSSLLCYDLSFPSLWTKRIIGLAFSKRHVSAFSKDPPQDLGRESQKVTPE